jgi:hypothetical protein
MSLRLVLLAIASTTLLAACGESATDQSTADQVPQTVTVTETVAAAPTAEAEPEPTAEPEEEIAADPARGSSDGPAGCIKVPDVEGGDHQLAQDTMQAEGLYLLQEEDATGQDRALILDRNWTVVEQRPAAGECVSDDTTILLRSKKDDE